MQMRLKPYNLPLGFPHSYLHPAEAGSSMTAIYLYADICLEINPHVPHIKPVIQVQYFRSVLDTGSDLWTYYWTDVLFLLKNLPRVMK